MNQFVAPQFIDVEDRIIGPITTRQFIMAIVWGVILFLSYKIFDLSLLIPIALVDTMWLVIFGFIKINGRKFGDYIGSMMEAIRRPKVRVWSKQVMMSQLKEKEEDIDSVKTDFVPRKSMIEPKHLAELALIVDTGGRYEGEE
jgi:hypothetical protein